MYELRIEIEEMLAHLMWSPGGQYISGSQGRRCQAEDAEEEGCRAEVEKGHLTV